MIKNIFIYFAILLSAFIFNIFFYAWFSWYTFLITLFVPLLSLLFSLPFMIINAIKGFSIFTQEQLTIGDELSIGITSGNGKGRFCPLVKVKFKIENQFTKEKKSIKFIYAGYLQDKIFNKSTTFTKNCGCLDIRAKYLKIYDLLGIFFIPIKINYHNNVLVMPKENKPTVIPDFQRIQIIGYKPKKGGFTEEYELRNYQKGDSLKNIHWKISARYDQLIVKEPSTPVYRPLVLKPVITNKPLENNATLGKFLYLANKLLKNKTEFYCICPDGKTCVINSKQDIKNFFLYLYNNQAIVQTFPVANNPVTYTITHNTEAVSN